MKRVSARVIVNDLLTQFGFTSLVEADIFDFIGDAIKLIGYGLHQEVLYTQTNIDFFKIHYPCNCIKFLNAYHNGKLLERKHCTKGYNNKPFGWLEEVLIDDIKLIQVRDKIIALENQDIEELEARELLLRDVIKSFDFIQGYNKKVHLDDHNWIKEGKNVIETSLEQGNVYLEYIGMALDEEGIPLLYDEVRYLNAIKYYCTFILIQSGNVHPTISYEKAEQLQTRWILKAQNYHRRFDAESAQQFRAVWTNVLHEATKHYKYSNR